MFLSKHRTGVLAGLIGGFRIKSMRRKLVLPWPFALIPPLFTTNYSRETSGIGYSILLRKRRRGKRKGLLYGIGRLWRDTVEASHRAPGHLSVHVPDIYTFPSAGAMDFLESAQERGKPVYFTTRPHRTKQ